MFSSNQPTRGTRYLRSFGLDLPACSAYDAFELALELSGRSIGPSNRIFCAGIAAAQTGLRRYHAAPRRLLLCLAALLTSRIYVLTKEARPVLASKRACVSVGERCTLCLRVSRASSPTISTNQMRKPATKPARPLYNDIVGSLQPLDWADSWTSGIHNSR